MEILFLLAGLIFTALGLFIIFSEARARSGAIEVSGRVIGFSTGRSSDRSFHSVAKYLGPDGRNRYVEGSVGSSSPLNSVGDPVTVLIQPGAPEKAAIRSPLTFVLGGVVALMGLISCIVFFAVFRSVTTLSLAGIVPVVIWGAWKVRTSLRDKPMSLQVWRDYKSKLLGPGTFTDETKGNIRWADPVTVQNALRNAKRANRFAIPILLIAGAGLLCLGIHLHNTTAVFLEKAVSGPGVVVEQVASHSSDSTTYAPVVEFEHEGRTYRFKDSVGSSPPSYRTGDAVGVLYDPSRPDNARIDRGRWNKAMPILVASAGALSCLLGIWIIVGRRKRGQHLGLVLWISAVACISAMTACHPTSHFQATGSMATARSGHSATLLSDGKVLVGGGIASDYDHPCASAELFDER
jgi:hypothetical protein